MKVDYEATNRVLDIIHEGYDIATRVGDLSDSNLSARKIAELGYSLYVTPIYLETISSIKTPEDLEKADLIAFSIYSNGLKLIQNQDSYETKRPPKLVANGNFSVKGAIMNHLGIALLPDILVKDERKNNEVARILEGWGRPKASVHAVLPSNKYLTSKVRAFIDLASKESKKFSL